VVGNWNNVGRPEIGTRSYVRKMEQGPVAFGHWNKEEIKCQMFTSYATAVVRSKQCGNISVAMMKTPKPKSRDQRDQPLGGLYLESPHAENESDAFVIRQIRPQEIVQQLGHASHN
jgi:hypothetical protein